MHSTVKVFVLFQDEARQGEIIRTVHEGEQTLDMVSEPPLPKRKKTFSKTSRSVHGEEQQRQNLINPLNAELNPICHLLALLGAHHIPHVSRIRVKQAMSLLSRPDDEYDGLGKTYAAKLRRMPAAQRDIADKLINDILFKGLQSHLTPSTFISDCGYTSGAWMSRDTPSPASTYSNPTPSATQ
jgi:hypothetical protein